MVLFSLYRQSITDFFLAFVSTKRETVGMHVTRRPVAPWFLPVIITAILALTLTGCSSAGAGGGGSAAIDFEGSFDTGSSTIEGTVTFSSTPASGRGLALTVQKTSPSSYSEFDSTFTANGSSSMSNRITNVSDGTYRVRMQVDMDGNSSFADAADLDGWYAGTTSTPITTSSAATLITVSGGSSTGNDFGIAP